MRLLGDVRLIEDLAAPTDGASAARAIDQASKFEVLEYGDHCSCSS